jgi:HK97 family phage portal protein
MTAQMFQEKMTTQLCLNNNAFALIIRNPETGTPIQLYPIPAISVEAIFDENQRMYLKFLYRNGKSGCFPYDDILHLRQDWYDNEVFGSPIAPALASLMECVGTIDQGIVKAVQNSGAIRWLLKYATPMRPEDLKSNVKQFVDNYMSLSSEVLGAAGVDGKADAIQIKPTDFVPGALIGDKIRERVYALFNTNAHIVQSDYTEDQWNAYYESEIEPLAIQFGSALDQKIFSRKELAFGNQIVYESSNLAFASMRTKLDLVQLVDRGELSPNEHRRILNLPPIPGGDIYIRRLDTAPVEGGDGNAD